MSVSLSPLAGAGAQFFDNNGVPLAGGLIYTYAAGTTTALATYTTISGNIANSNPIVLDAAGRTPQEIWLTVGFGYKFVLKNASDSQIGSYDNIPSNAPPPFANDASSVAYEQGYQVTAGSFVVGKSYLITAVGNTNFVSIGAASSTVGVYFTATGAGSGTGTAQLSRTVQAKFRDSISVKDFGATGDGTTDDTNAILAAIAAMPSNGSNLLFPQGTYIVNADNYNGLKFSGKTNFAIEGYGATIKVKNAAPVVGGYEVMSFFTCSNGAINGLTIDGNRANRTITGETSAHCLTICTSCSQITVNDVIAVNSPADGFLINTFTPATASTYPTDISLVNCVADNAYRNGLSVIGSLRCTVQGGEYKNTNGILPKCGIDVEPDASYTYGNRYMVIDGARLFNNDGYGLTLGGPITLNQNILITNVTGSDNDLGFMNIASCENPTLRDVVAYNHPTATRGIIDVGTKVTNPIIDGADFVSIAASGSNYCIYLHGSITGVPTVRNINVESVSCPILYCDVRSDIDSIYGNYVTATDAITVTQAYSSIKNVQLSNCTDRSIYVSGTNVELDGIHLVNCGQANSRAIQFQAASAIVKNVSILFTGARPANFVGILFGSGAPRFISNVLAKAASSDFNASSVMTFSSGTSGASIRNVSPNPFSLSQVYDPGSIANGSIASVALTVSGVTFGMICSAVLSISTSGLVLSAQVSAADTITVTLTNNTGGAVDLASSTLTVYAELY